MSKFRKIVSRQREPGEIPTMRAAIRNHCLHCCGYQPTEVEKCTAPKCWLYPWRLGKTPPELKKPVTDAQRAQGRRLASFSSKPQPSSKEK